MEIDKLLLKAQEFKKNNNYIESEALYKNILIKFPYKFEAYLNLGLINVEKKNYYKAINYFKDAIIYHPKKNTSYINLANTYLIIKNYNEAAINFEIAHKFDPNDQNIVNSLSYIYNKLDSYESGIKIIKKGLILNKDNYYILNILGTIYYKLEDIDLAIKYLERAIKSNRNYLIAYLNLLLIYEKTNKLEKINFIIEKAFKIFGKKTELLLIEANYFNRIKDYLKSNTILLSNSLKKEIINDNEKLIKLYDLLGKNYDKLNITDKAFINFEKRNILKAATPSNKKFKKNIILENIVKYQKYFNNNLNIEKTKNKVIAKNFESSFDLVFLLGFPRSGTTLLDTILRYHSQISVLEEQPLIANIRNDFFIANNGNLNSLKNISDTEISRLRSRYFDLIKSNLQYKNNAKIIIDKLPLNIIEIGFINRIFPNSKIILMLRHPCDAVLSCFIADFKINEAMANYYTLEESAFFYDEVFNLWEVYKQKLDLNYQIIKYEDIVVNFKSTIHNLIKFLNLEWEEDLKNFNKKALNRNIIKTPSYSQVIEPLYLESIDRWKRYSDAIFLENKLDKWIKNFNY